MFFIERKINLNVFILKTLVTIKGLDGIAFCNDTAIKKTT